MADVLVASGQATQRVVAFAFDSPLLAQQALRAALRLQEQHDLVLHDAVFVSRTVRRPAEVFDRLDPTAVAAAVPSSLFGALVGTLVAGPLGFLIGGVLAGGTGALIAKWIATDIPMQVIRQLRALTRPGETVLALLVSNWAVPAVLDELHRFTGAHVVYAELPQASVEIVRRVLADI